MAIADDFTVAQNGDIRYVGAAHGASGAGYHTVISFHRWLQGLADDAVASASSSDFLDITDNTPSERSTDNIIRLINGYNIDDTAAEHLYDGSIIQDGGNVVYDGLVVIANQGMNLQIIQNGAVVTNDFWNYNVAGTHTGSANAAVLTDSTKTWTTNQWVGYIIKNTTDGSEAVITSNTSNTITGTLMGGTENDWDASDAYKIVVGLNADAAQGLSHRFMLKVRTAAADIDGRRLIGITRVYGKTYSEFKINGTSNGNNVLALTYASDLNNTTALSAQTSAPFTGVSNTFQGYNGIDVDGNTTNEFYYSKWDKGSCTINQFYERIKYLTRGEATTPTMYGLEPRLFRGITHEINLSGTNSGTFSAFEKVTWSGGEGQMLAINNTTASSATKMWIQLLKGVAPTNGQLITGFTSTATATNSGTPTDRTLSFPVCGVSTGSAIIGAYGFGIEAADLTNNDKVFDLTNTQITPPNNVVFTVSGLVASEDYVLVGPESGGVLQVSQFNLNTALTTADITSVIIDEAIPSDTPTTGTIRVADNNGVYRRLQYTSRTGSTFTIDPTASEAVVAGVADFNVVNASAGNDVYISYIDKLATATTATFTSVYSSPRNLFVRVRDGGGSPIKTFESTATLGSGGGSASAIRTTDA